MKEKTYRRLAQWKFPPQTITDNSPANIDNGLMLLERTNVVPISNSETKEFAFPSLPCTNRELSDTSSTSSTVGPTLVKSDGLSKINKPVKHSNKKPKINAHSLEDIRQNLSPLKLLLDNVDKKYPLDFSKLTSFLYESYDHSDISDIIEK